jgi:hypothetical protein
VVVSRSVSWGRGCPPYVVVTLERREEGEEEGRLDPSHKACVSSVKKGQWTTSLSSHDRTTPTSYDTSVHRQRQTEPAHRLETADRANEPPDETTAPELFSSSTTSFNEACASPR